MHNWFEFRSFQSAYFGLVTKQIGPRLEPCNGSADGQSTKTQFKDTFFFTFIIEQLILQSLFYYGLTHCTSVVKLIRF